MLARVQVTPKTMELRRGKIQLLRIEGPMRLENTHGKTSKFVHRVLMVLHG